MSKLDNINGTCHEVDYDDNGDSSGCFGGLNHKGLHTRLNGSTWKYSRSCPHKHLDSNQRCYSCRKTICMGCHNPFDLLCDGCDSPSPSDTTLDND